jgi:hypothetical protein
MTPSPRIARTRMPGREVHVYNIGIELWQDDEALVFYSPEEWAEMVKIVGIAPADWIDENGRRVD